jgi:ADP-ribose pyrophosphatase YjhB (NUDIX family)
VFLSAAGKPTTHYGFGHTLREREFNTPKNMDVPDPAHAVHNPFVAHVEHLHTAVKAGAPMQRITAVGAIAGVGLDGDRYASGRGYYTDSRVSRAITLIEAEVLEAIASESGLALEPGETRRNVTTSGVSLNALLGQLFWLGEVLCEGTASCAPCKYLTDLTAKPLLRPLARRGGLRADVLTSGRIRIGDRIEPATARRGVSVVVTRDNTILLAKRRSPHGAGTWSTPGGHPQQDETMEQCALRELREETTLVGTEALRLGQAVNYFPESCLIYRTTFVRVAVPDGVPRICEPEKHETWSWYPLTALPTPLFAPVASFAAKTLMLDP